MKGLNNSVAEAFSKTPLLELHLGEMRFAGNDGCNLIMGTIHTINFQNLKIGPVASTMMACPKMDYSNKYNSQLEAVRTYQLKDFHLVLYDESGSEVLKFKKVD